MCLGLGVKFVLVITLRPNFNTRKVSKSGGSDVASRTIVKLEGVQYDRTELACEECLESVNFFAKQRTSHATTCPSQVRSLGHTTGVYLMLVVKAIVTCRTAQGFSGTLQCFLCIGREPQGIKFCEVCVYVSVS